MQLKKQLINLNLWIISNSPLNPSKIVELILKNTADLDLELYPDWKFFYQEVRLMCDKYNDLDEKEEELLLEALAFDANNYQVENIFFEYLSKNMLKKILFKGCTFRMRSCQWRSIELYFENWNDNSLILKLLDEEKDEYIIRILLIELNKNNPELAKISSRNFISSKDPYLRDLANRICC